MDASPSDVERQAHLSGPIAAALMEQAEALLAASSWVARRLTACPQVPALADRLLHRSGLASNDFEVAMWRLLDHIDVECDCKGGEKSR